LGAAIPRGSLRLESRYTSPAPSLDFGSKRGRAISAKDLHIGGDVELDDEAKNVAPVSIRQRDVGEDVARGGGVREQPAGFRTGSRYVSFKCFGTTTQTGLGAVAHNNQTLLLQLSLQG
jgi:hypothetical protein